MASALPLKGVRVLDCTQLMAGPFCSLLLADMGADIVKVEKPSWGDDSRRFPPFINGESAPFMGVNRNKRGIVLDLQSEGGRGVFRRLARTSDILVENFRPGTLDRLGFDYDSLREDNPALIYCSISGFGQTGPYRNRGGFDLVGQAMSGIMSLTGDAKSPPIKVGVPMTDLNAGMYACYGILSAYIHRLQTGLGQQVDTSLLEAGIGYTFWESSIYFATGQAPGPMGSAHRLVAPYQVMRARDGYVAIGAANQSTWEKLCAALERKDLVADPRFLEESMRLRHYEELAALLEETLQRETVSHWLVVLDKAGVPSGPLYNLAQVYADPQVRARDMVVELEHPVAGRIRNIGLPVKLSTTPGSIRLPAPTLGQHTREVLLERGFGSDEIDALERSGALGKSSPT